MTSNVTLHLGDCLDIMSTLEDNSIDAIVTDPPAGIAFMGKKWDTDHGGRDAWIDNMTKIAAECLRVLKPGGHALVWALPRTSHWTATAWENAGFEVRDRVAHVFGSGFPKSMDVSKQLDKMAGAEREVVGVNEDYLRRKPNGMKTEGATAYGYSQTQQETNPNITAPATPEAAQWAGWGTALKPAMEDWWLLRKPFRGTVAANVLEWGTGAINVDGCRIMTNEELGRPQGTMPQPMDWGNKSTGGDVFTTQGNPAGRWPANLVHDGSEEVTALFPQTSPSNASVRKNRLRHGNDIYGNGKGIPQTDLYSGHSDTGSAARFFYAAKASRSDRDEGLPDGEHSHHPTVKPTALMRWLVRLITPPGGVVLDPFMGSGSTGKAATLEGFDFIGIEMEAEYLDIARRRIEAAQSVLLSNESAIKQLSLIE